MFTFRASRWRLFGVAAFVVMGLNERAYPAEPPPSASAILQELREFRECGSVLYIAAHPDDENTQFIAYMAKDRGVRTGYLSLTRGEGGQNLIGPELGDPLGVIRTQELLAARRIDGGQQFFTRAKDFGFSKDYEQTLSKWDRREVLSDMVRVIRRFQPDVIVTRFPPEAGGTHGHHTASTVLALEAFKLAGDAEAFPEQLEGEDKVTPWQPKRIFWNAFRGGHERPTLTLNIGGYLPLFGQSVGEIAALSRSSHRSQGYGSIASRGARADEFQALDGQPVGDDLFDGIETSWKQLPGGEKIDAAAAEIIARFDPLSPSASVPALLAMMRETSTLDYPTRKSWFNDKGKMAARIVRDCLGLYVETTVAQGDAVPGETLKYHHTVILRTDSKVPVIWKGVWAFEEGDTMKTALKPNEPVVYETTRTLESDAPLSQPYWLRVDGKPGMYQVADLQRFPPELGGPWEETPFDVEYTFEIGGTIFFVDTEAIHVTADPAKGEVRRRLDVIPPVSLELGRDVQLFTPSAEAKIAVEVKAFRAEQNGTLTLDAPAGWKVTPESQAFRIATVGDHARFVFTVTAPSQPTTASLTARATVDGHSYNTGRQEIRYEHIPPQLLQPLARVKAVCLDIAIRGKQIGYLPGAGDRTAESLTAMGYEVTSLTGADLTPERLRAFDALVIGVRAFNVRTDVTASLPALFAYAENGGNVVVQYNTPNDLKIARFAPYDLTLSRDLPHNRVTNENAPITLLVPDHPVFNTPNKITPADFEGWVQERGLNFPNTWDEAHWTALLACSDPHEAPLKSGLLVANYGTGHFIYTGLSFFRQLPAGVPGAYRLFANLVSLGK